MDVMRILQEKYLLEKFSNALKIHLDLIIILTRVWKCLTISAPDYCYLHTEGYWFHTTVVKSVPLHSLSLPVQMPVAHVIWQPRLLGLTRLRRPTRTPYLSPAGIVPLAHTHFSANCRKETDYFKYCIADPQLSVLMSSWNWCCRETEAGNIHVFVLSLLANRIKYFSFPINPKILYNT